MERSTLIPTINKIKKDKQILKWIDGLEKQTKPLYLQCLADFCQAINLEPIQMLEISRQELIDRVPPWELQIEDWFENYKKYGIERKRSPSTCNTRKAIIASFFHFYKIPTPVSNVRRNKTNNPYKNIRELPTKEEIRFAVEACKSYKLKALILCQSSSGLSAADVVRLSVEQFKNGLVDVGETNQICMLKLERQKTGKEFITFLSHEAVYMVKKHLELERTDITSSSPLFNSKTRKGSLTAKGYVTALNRLNKDLGWDNDKWAFGRLTSHMLRKYFNSQLVYAGMPEEVREYLMGHVLNDKVRDAYFLTNERELMTIYFKYIKSLAITDIDTVTIDAPEVKALKEKNIKLEDRVKALEEFMNVSKEIDERERKLKK